MKVYEYTPGAVISGSRSIALGFFDGVHVGHRQLLKSAVSLARESGISSSIFTFTSTSKLPKLSDTPLYTDAEKAELIAELGIDEIIVADFSLIKDLSAESFINDVLIDALGCKVAISGRDFRFGRGALGNPELLASEFAKRGLRYVEIGDVSTDSGKVSTTAIKRCLSEGRLKEATAMLGSPYFIRSYVEHGRGIGKALGFPTLNTELGGRVAFLKNGVYKTETEIDGKRYPSLTNVGTCPTFESRPAHAETFIIDFDGDLYGSTVKIYFHSFIREEQKFSSPDELIKRINKDIEIAKGE